MKIDVFKHKEQYFTWKKKFEHLDLKDLTKQNSDLIKAYVFDMENGSNVSARSVKGSRSYIRLNNIKQRLVFITREFQERMHISNLSEVSEEHLFKFFNGMRNGDIRRKDGKEYQSVSDYVKVFKAFWHWYMKVNRKKGIEINDITLDLDTSNHKPRWVYLNEAQIKQLCNNAKYDYKVLIMFLFDSGIRSPSELANIKVSDFYNDFKELQIRDEISKTFGRRIKLLLCSELVKDYVKSKNLQPQDFFFTMSYLCANKYLKRLSKRVFGDTISEAGAKYSELTLYDFRHCSCCYWLPRYKSESALKYRFGWKKSDKIHYYSELLGMKDTISEEDLLVDTTKTEIERRLEQTEKKNTILNDKVILLETKLSEIRILTEDLFEQIAQKK